MYNFFNNKKELIIIRLDSIGDYVLFRNFLYEIKNSEKYKNYKLTLLGNSVWQSLVEHFDNKVVDNFIWLDKSRHKSDEKYAYSFKRTIRRKEYDVLINPVFAREQEFAEYFSREIKAKEKIVCSGSLAAITGVQREFENLNYTKVIETEESDKFEFFRNAEIISKIIEKEVFITKPFFEFTSNIDFSGISSEYAVVFPGAQSSNREWDINNYATVINFIINEYGLDVVLAGSPADMPKGEGLVSAVNSQKLVNLIGQTKLYELPYLFKDARFILSSDTCAYHFGVALNRTTICLSNGNTFCQFVPYPDSVYYDVHYVFAPEIEKNLDKFSYLTNKYKYYSHVNINTIQSQNVIELIQKIIK